MKEKEKLLAKLNIKDYKSELELILEEKKFDEEAKSLILSIFYKIENFYKDYQFVKTYCTSKNEFLDNFIDIIKQKCKEIVILPPQEFNSKTKYTIDKEKGKIVCFPNEVVLMYAIYDLNEGKEKNSRYNLGDLTNKCVNYVITRGDVVNSIEPLRDFSGWSWNPNIDNINNITYNLIFQNLLMLFGYDELKGKIGRENILIAFEEMVKLQKYGKRGETFLNALYELCIAMYNNESKENHQKCLKYKDSLSNKINMLKSREDFIEQEAKNNNKYGDRIKEIDNILNSRSMLMEEFDKIIKGNKKTFFSLSDYAESLEEEKQKLLNDVAKEKKQLSINTYEKSQEKYNQVLSLYKLISDEHEKVNVQTLLVNLQKAFLECEKLKIPKCTTKKDFYNLTNELRYYANLLFKKDKTTISISKINTEFKSTSKVLINMLIENKIIDIGFKSEKLNYQILSHIFKTKMIKLDNLTLKIMFKEEKMVEIEYYDANMLDYNEVFEIPFEEEISVRKDKKIKLFKIGG